MSLGVSLSLGARVRGLMHQYHITPNEVAAHTGITPNLLARWLHQTEMARKRPDDHDHGGAAIADISLRSAHPSLVDQLEQRMARWITRVTARLQRHQHQMASKGMPAAAAAAGDVDRANDSASSSLAPIRLELTVLQPSPYKIGANVASICDNLMWDVAASSSAVTPRAFLDQTLRDLRVDAPEVWIGPLEKMMVQQIEEYRQKRSNMRTTTKVEGASDGAAAAAAAASTGAAAAVSTAAVSASSASAASSSDSTRFLRVPLDIIDHDVRLQDAHVIWDLEAAVRGDEDDAIDAFAGSFARDAGLPAEFAVKIAWSIRKQLATHRIAVRAGAKTPPAQVVTRADEREFGRLRSPNDSAPFVHRVSGLTKRHEVAVHQLAPPPYIAYFTPPSHRHAFYVGEVVDAMHLPPPPTSRGHQRQVITQPTAHAEERTATATNTPTTPTATSMPTSSMSMDGPAKLKRRRAKVVTHYQLLSCTEEKLRLRRDWIVKISCSSSSGSSVRPSSTASANTRVRSSPGVVASRAASSTASAASSAPGSPRVDRASGATPMDLDDDDLPLAPTPRQAARAEQDDAAATGIVEEEDDEELEERKSEATADERA